MQVETTRFGDVEVAEEEVVTFPDGLPGFARARRMVILGGGEMPGGEPIEGPHAMYWLQDVDDPELAFMTIVPWAAYPDYDIEVGDDEFGAADEDDLVVLAIVSVRRDNGGVRLTTNLLAPIVVDTDRRRGKQVILRNQDWPIQAPLSEAGGVAAGAG
jgi:flagellar assembly factor FliW